MQTIAGVLIIVANVIFWLVLIQLIVGLLIQFDVLNRRQPLVYQIYNGVSALLEPLLGPIRRILPPAGGIDFSPLVLLVGIQILIFVIQTNA